MDSLSLLQILMGEFHDKLGRLGDMVKREARFPDAPNKIKVAIGMRRAGKTFFLYQHVQALLKKKVPKSSILYVNFEDDRLLPLSAAKLSQLVEAFYELYPANYERKCYLFFDEIQNVKDWPTVIRRLHDSKNAEIFITGSSAKLLSKEISTSLRGRSLSTEIWPYSFNEFLAAKKIEIDRTLHDKKTSTRLKQLFETYLTEGGFPEVTHYSPEVRQQTLQEYLDVAIFRDIVERHSISDPALVKYMILTTTTNAAKLFSINKFYNDAKSQGYRTGKDALYDYADYIEDCYLSFFVGVHDKSIRRVQTNPKKNYVIDPGLARALTLEFESDLGRLFENVVYLDLRRMGCKIDYVLTEDRYEVDFLAQSPGGRKKTFQVTWDMQDKETREREERALQACIKETKIPGEIITVDSYIRHGIHMD